MKKITSIKEYTILNQCPPVVDAGVSFVPMVVAVATIIHSESLKFTSSSREYMIAPITRSTSNTASRNSVTFKKRLEFGFGRASKSRS